MDEMSGFSAHYGHWRLVAMIVVIVSWFVYARLAYREEEEMVNRFGTAYLQYREQLPMFFPRCNAWGKLLAALRILRTQRSMLDAGINPLTE